MQPPFHWARRGLVYSATGQRGFDQSHCHKPTPVLVDESTIRVFFGVRDARNTTRTTYVDLDASDPWRVKYVHDRPVLDTGKLGAFDDSGANVSTYTVVVPEPGSLALAGIAGLALLSRRLHRR